MLFFWNVDKAALLWLPLIILRSGTKAGCQFTLIYMLTYRVFFFNTLVFKSSLKMRWLRSWV